MRVIQSICQSPVHDNDAAFSFGNVWVGTIGGSALPTDPDPNTSAPSPSRIIRCTPNNGARLCAGSGSVSNLYVAAGVVAASSISFQPYFFDDNRNRWIAFGVVSTLTPTGIAANTTSLGLGAIVGAKAFLQITANTLVQALGYRWG